MELRLINILMAAAFAAIAPVNAQTTHWSWLRQDQVLNPSGLEVNSLNAQFNALDWNGDGRWDFVINDSTRPQLFVGVAASAGNRWERNSTPFPSLGADWNRQIPRAFQFVDFDLDGDFDLAADAGQFWWNIGSSNNPIWVKDDSVLAGTEFYNQNYSFVDYDHDGDWDLAADAGYYSAAEFYWNTTGGKHPRWMTDNSAISQPLTNRRNEMSNAVYRDADGDGNPDLFGVITVPADPGTFLGMIIYLNKGSLFEPIWEPLEWSLYYSVWWAGLLEVTSSYQILDFDRDGDIDILIRDSSRHFAFLENSGTGDSLVIDVRNPKRVGPIIVESNAIPFLFDHQSDGALDLVVSEDFLYDFAFNFYHEGRPVSFTANHGVFDLNNSTNGWFQNPYPIQVTNFANHFHFNFNDFDGNGDADYVFSYYRVSLQDTITGSRVIFFRNEGSNAKPDWKPDSSLFAQFDLSPRRFWAPNLIDIDADGDDDVLIKRGNRFVFYENISPGLPLAWREQPAFMPGLADAPHYLATFADLTRDGLPDLIFGEENGALSFYANIGTARAPAWQLVPGAFAGIDVGDFAAPALGDVDGDSRLDLIAGNANGRLFFYRNESTVQVTERTREALPTGFGLSLNFPNPVNAAGSFAPSTTIYFQLPRRSFVTIRIYNTLGQKVRTLYDRRFEAGQHEVVWDGRDETGRLVTSGIYLVTMQADEFVQTRKLTFIH